MTPICTDPLVTRRSPSTWDNMDRTTLLNPNHGPLPFNLRALTTLTSHDTSELFASMEKPITKSSSDHRRSNKPIMEKRRRARINNCLGELKGLILEAMKKDPARHSKLEKADILEMTVKHLQNMQRQQMAIAVATDPTVITKFRAGFNECATEVARYVSRIEGVDPGVRQRLLVHLRNCLTGLNHITPATFACLTPGGPSPFMTPSINLQVPSTAAAALSALSQMPFSMGDINNNGSAASRMLNGIHLVPSRLPNGDIAFVLPQQKKQQHHHQEAPLSHSPPSQLSDDDDYCSDRSSPALSTSSGPRRPTSPPPPPPSHRFPAFPTNPVVSSDSRRTPSAFTSIRNSSTKAPPVNPTRRNAVTPSVSCSAFTPASSADNRVSLLRIKTEEEVPLRSQKEQQQPQVAPAPKVPNAAGFPRGAVSLAPSPLLPSPIEQITATPPPSLIALAPPPPAAVYPGTGENQTPPTTRNQRGAYDLSRPSTSNVCSMTDNDKMWRPW